MTMTKAQIDALELSVPLDEGTRKQGVHISGEVYSMHVTDDGVVVITDFYDYSKIYSIQTMDFFRLLSSE